MLAESQPPYKVAAITLRQWYTQYHPDAGPLAYETAAALEEGLGDHMREVYAGMGYRKILTALSMRRKAIHVSEQTIRTWCTRYAKGKLLAVDATMFEQRTVYKRPAAKAIDIKTLRKRPAAHIIEEPATIDVEDEYKPNSTAASSTDVVDENMEVSTAASSSDAFIPEIKNADELEARIGARYRNEVSDLGLGIQGSEMQTRIAAWGCIASKDACKFWIQKYRCGDGAKEGSSKIFELARQDLQRWYYVDKLDPRQMQEKYRSTHGIYAHQCNLVKWLKSPAQQLTVLDNNEDIHTNACGEYVLNQLQQGKSPAQVAQDILSLYLVRTTTQRVQAYRYYREQHQDYWTCEQLERSHWKALYEEVDLDHILGRIHHTVARCTGRSAALQRLHSVRSTLCLNIGLSEEIIPMSAMSQFYGRNEQHAKLKLLYPDARVVEDSMPIFSIEAYQSTFAEKPLPMTTYECHAKYGYMGRCSKRESLHIAVWCMTHVSVTPTMDLTPEHRQLLPNISQSAGVIHGIYSDSYGGWVHQILLFRRGRVRVTSDILGQ